MARQTPLFIVLLLLVPSPHSAHHLFRLYFSDLNEELLRAEILSHYTCVRCQN